VKALLTYIISLVIKLKIYFEKGKKFLIKVQKLGPPPLRTTEAEAARAAGSAPRAAVWRGWTLSPSGLCSRLCHLFLSAREVSVSRLPGGEEEGTKLSAAFPSPHLPVVDAVSICSPPSPTDLPGEPEVEGDTSCGFLCPDLHLTPFLSWHQPLQPVSPGNTSRSMHLGRGLFCFVLFLTLSACSVLTWGS
jgi:hypothetical protein